MSLKSKTTQWFPHTKNPARVGVYQRQFADVVNGVRFSYWDGHRWGRLEVSPWGAEQTKNKISAWQNLSWRGLVKEET